MNCFNIDVRIYNICASSSSFCLFVFFVSCWLFVMLILINALIVLDCQADFDVDNIQCRELVNLYGYSAI